MTGRPRIALSDRRDVRVTVRGVPRGLSSRDARDMLLRAAGFQVEPRAAPGPRVLTLYLSARERRVLTRALGTELGAVLRGMVRGGT